MSTVTACSHCQAKYTVPSNAVGRKATCAKCGQGFVVSLVTAPAAKVAVENMQTTAPPVKRASPAAKPQATGSAAAPKQAPTSAAKAKLTEAELSAAFRGEFERVRVPLSYRFGILLAAVVMVGLVVFYLALIALAAWGTYYHAANNTWIAGMGGVGRARIFMVLVYIAPIFAGAVLVFFMFKPLLARPARRERSRSLTRQSEPLLFAFVDQVCETVGAPQPRRIDVDCQVNASASFRRGIWSMLGKDLVLTIGLPLVAGLSVREFGGVLAHEFAHFAQGAGMRLTYLVLKISTWFQRVVYQRDEWDEFLEEAGSDLDIRLSWIVGLAVLGVTIGRGVLWVLMHVGFLVSGVLMRQMEFDSDCCQTRFAGSKAFASTMRKVNRLSAASNLADAQCGEHLGERRLVEDLPELILLNAQMMPAETASEIEKEAAKSETSWFDTHPSARDRLAAAEKLAAPGVIHLERPARDLFHHFDAQAKATTWDLYMAIFGAGVPREALVPVPEFARAAKSRWKEPGKARRPEHYRYE